jgi:hypothetical protein
MNEQTERLTSDTRLRDLFCLVNQIEMAEFDRTAIKTLIAEVAHLKFCKGYDAARDFYRKHFDLNFKETIDE